MTFDPGTSVPQNFPAQEPDVFRRLMQIIAAQKREMFDTRASILANVSDIVADLTAKQATLTDLVGSEVSLGYGSGTWTASTALATTSMTSIGSFTVTAPLWATQFIAVGVASAQIIQEQSGTSFATAPSQSSARLDIGASSQSAYGLTTLYSEVGSPVDAVLTQIATPVAIAMAAVVGGATVTVTLNAQRNGGTSGYAQNAAAKAVFLFTR